MANRTEFGASGRFVLPVANFAFSSFSSKVCSAKSFRRAGGPVLVAGGFHQMLCFLYFGERRSSEGPTLGTGGRRRAPKHQFELLSSNLLLLISYQKWSISLWISGFSLKPELKKGFVGTWGTSGGYMHVPLLQYIWPLNH